jgi:hypothetical protein
MMRRDLLGEVHRARRRVLKIVYHGQNPSVDRSLYDFGRAAAEDPIQGGEFLDKLGD